MKEQQAIIGIQRLKYVEENLNSYTQMEPGVWYVFGIPHSGLNGSEALQVVLEIQKIQDDFKKLNEKINKKGSAAMREVPKLELIATATK